MTIGFRIRPVTERVARDLCARAARLQATHLGDAMHRLQTMRGGFRAFGGRLRVAGPAFPVKVRPGDNLMLHRALDLAAPGDVLVVDGGGERDVGLADAPMLGWAARRGIAALVIDGAIRDAAAIGEIAIGVWARGVTPAGPWKDGPGEIGCPVACGGQVVMPGDLIAADEDGVVVVPREAAAAVIAAAEAHQAREAEAQAAIEAGRWERGWAAKELQGKGCDGA